MELAVLPGNAREHCFAGCLETPMGITDDQCETVQAPIFQLGQKCPPMNFGFKKRHRAAQHITVTLGINATADEHRRIQYLTNPADFLAARIQDDVSAWPAIVVDHDDQLHAHGKRILRCQLQFG